MTNDEETIQRSRSASVSWRCIGSAMVVILASLGPSTFILPLCAADWPTNRGNLARTGCVDGQPGPSSGKVLWVHKSSDHYVAAPVPAGDSILVSALAAFNTSNFQA
ncbi:MAG: hypothetical protein FJ302_19295, partial [Planctomycetes bacterium]|nr:hypothetical protein [Planctomycetota bacterium]